LERHQSFPVRLRAGAKGRKGRKESFASERKLENREKKLSLWRDRLKIRKTSFRFGAKQKKEGNELSRWSDGSFLRLNEANTPLLCCIFIACSFKIVIFAANNQKHTMIKTISKYMLLAIIALLCVNVWAQTLKWRDMYQVKKKDTLFGIAKSYGITLEELITANPDMKVAGYELKKGDYIFIPYPSTQKPAACRAKEAPTPAVKSVQNALEAKKREYLKTFSQSSIIHITTPFYFLALSQGKFVLKDKGVIKHKFPINQITQIIINAQISLSSAVIKECAKRKISINFIDEKTNLSYATLFTANSAISKTAASQISLLKTKRPLRIAQQFIIGKLKNQINYLKYLDKYHKNLSSQIRAIQEILKSRIQNATSVNELLGFEGSAATAYWQAIAQAIDYKFSFSGRVTQGATDVVNSALNYGYAILYSKILKSIAAAGLSPHVSYLHALDEQKPTLAFDLIEEFRAFIVDRAVISMINKNEPFEIKGGLLSAATRQNIAKNVNEKLFAHTEYRGEELKAQDIIDKQAYALKRAVTQNEKYKPFIGRFQ